jgi:hypothetical protein
MSARLGTVVVPPTGVPSSRDCARRWVRTPPDPLPPRSPTTAKRTAVRPRLHSVGPDAYPNWDAIYLDNVERLYRIMYARVGNRDAEDLTAGVPRSTPATRASASVGEIRAYLLATARTVLASHRAAITAPRSQPST